MIGEMDPWPPVDTKVYMGMVAISTTWSGLLFLNALETLYETWFGLTQSVDDRTCLYKKVTYIDKNCCMLTWEYGASSKARTISLKTNCYGFFGNSNTLHVVLKNCLF